jgi:Mrp family chromosome partitioning ATPase
MLGIQDQQVMSSSDGWVPVYLNTQGQGEGGKLACMSIGFLLNKSSESVVWRGPKKNAMIKQFLGQVNWGRLDYLIIDTPPGTSDEHISLLETLRPLLMEQPREQPRRHLATLSSILVSTPQALALLDVSKELSFVRRTKLPLLGLIENMSGYVCPHCGDLVGVFGQGGGESFCRLENEKLGTEEYEGGCRFLGRIPIDRELVSLLDDVAENRTAGFLGEEETKKERKTLVERYREIPSFKVVKTLAEQVKKLIQDQSQTNE